MGNKSAITVVMVAIMMVTVTGVAAVVASNDDEVQLTLYDDILGENKFSQLCEYLATEFNASSVKHTSYGGYDAYVFKLPPKTDCEEFGTAIHEYCREPLHKYSLYAYMDNYSKWMTDCHEVGIYDIPNGLIVSIRVSE